MNPDGSPLVWYTTQTIKYKVDPVGLGRLNYEQSLALVQLAMSVWESVDGTGIQFEYLGPEDTDITADNKQEYRRKAQDERILNRGQRLTRDMFMKKVLSAQLATCLLSIFDPCSFISIACRPNKTIKLVKKV